MKPIYHRLIGTNKSLIPLASHQCYNEMLFEDLLYSGFLGKTHTLQKVGDKPCKDAGPCHIG